MNEINTLLTTFHPVQLPENWAPMREFVLDSVRDNYAAGRTREDVARALAAFTQFADWVLYTGVGPLDATILRADVIDAYTTQRATEITPAVAERERKVIRTIAGIPNTVETRPVSTSAPAERPYTKAEQADILRWTTSQQHAERRRNCGAIAALGLGCGLTANEVMQARARDLIVLSDGLLAVRLPERIVPVTAAWNDSLTASTDMPGDAYLVCPKADARDSRTLVSFLSADRPRPSARRMRVTWMVNQLDGGTPVRTVMLTAGLTSPDFLRRLIAFTANPEGDARVEALRLNSEVAR